MIKPLISEKSLYQAKQNKFCFICDNRLSKSEMVKIIKETYGVDTYQINRLVRKGKFKKTRYGQGRRNDHSIAIITLRKGQKITGFEFPEKSSDSEKEKSDIKESIK